MKKILHRSQYRLDRILSKGVMAQLGLLALFAFVTVSIGMTVMFFGLFDPENASVESIHHKSHEDIADAFWWSLTHALDPGTFVSNYGASWQVMLFAFSLTIIGMALFGAFIGLVSAGIHERLRLLDQGIGPVVEEGHILLLGWNNLAPAVISRLVDIAGDARLVVLADRDIEEMRHDLRMSVEIDRNLARRVIFRQGNVVADHELERVSYQKASRIIVLSNERSSLDATANDIDAIKLLLMFADNRRWLETKPHIVAEISDVSNFEIANLAGKYQVPVVTSADLISRIMVQCSRQPDLSAVYFELFSASSNRLLMEHIPECTGMAFGSILNAFGRATPIGVCDILELEDRVVYIPDLNPPADHIIEEHEKIILIASETEAEFTPNGTAFDGLAPVPGEAFDLDRMKQVLILGWNRNIYTSLQLYDDYMAGGEVVVVSSLDENEARTLLDENLPKPLVNISVRVAQENYLKRAVLERYLADSPDAVVILSDDSGDTENPDSRVIMAMVLLQWILETHGMDADPHVIAEILDRSSTHSLEFFQGFEMVVTPDIVSLMLAHIARRNDIRTVVTELLSPNGQEIYLKPFDRYVAEGEAFRFGDLVTRAKQNDEIVWGVVRMTGPDGEKLDNCDVQINPDRTEPIALSQHDRLIVLSR
ncbi:CASTOR/POLLUX-related putative ion channel [Aestuariispira insulae]|nr:hypothetical protein [Aestuariispira insulae]